VNILPILENNSLACKIVALDSESLWPMIKYKVIQKPHEFLVEFHMHACNYLGRNFQTKCHHLLLQAILDRVKSTQVSDALDYAEKNNSPKTNGLGKPRSNWELCESSFIEKTKQKMNAALKLKNSSKLVNTEVKNMLTMPAECFTCFMCTRSMIET